MKKLWSILQSALIIFYCFTFMANGADVNRATATEEMSVNGTDANEDEYVLRNGYINIWSAETDLVKWDCLVYREPYEDTIMLRASDIAALAGISVTEDGETAILSRGTYHVEVDKRNSIASVYLMLGEEKLPLYDGEFKLSCTVQNHRMGDFLPMEEMFYLLNLTWYLADNNVYVYSPKETLWNVIGDCPTLASNMPTYIDVIGGSCGEVWLNAFKYSIAAIADEADLRMFVPFLFEKDKYETFLLNLSVPLSSRLTQEQTNGLEEAMQYVDLFYSFIDAFCDSHEVFNFDTPIFDVLYDISSSFVGSGYSGGKIDMKDLSKAGNFLENILDVYNLAKAVHTAHTWSDSFAEQINYLVQFPNNSSISKDTLKPLTSAAEKLNKKYGSEINAMLWESFSITLSKALDEGLVAVGGAAFSISLAFSLYSLSVEFLKLINNDYSAMLEAGDSAWDAKCGLGVSTVAYIDFANSIMQKSGTQLNSNDLIELRNKGHLTSNAAASCWLSIYKTSQLDDFDFYEDPSDKIIKTAEFLTRLEESSIYDQSLLLYTNFVNLNITYDIEGVQNAEFGRPYVSIDYVYLYYPIYIYDDYLDIANDISGNYILMNDLEFPDGHKMPEYSFEGSFHGNGHTISNIGEPLFNKISSSETICDLNLIGRNSYDITPFFERKLNYGLLAAGSYCATIQNCTFSGFVIANCPDWVGGSVGGIIGDASNAVIENCTSDFTVHLSVTNGSCNAGGLFGVANQSSITSCTHSGEINIISSFNDNSIYGTVYLDAGGISGRSYGTTISKCLNTGNVYSSGGYLTLPRAGGICAEGSPTVSECKNTGSVSAKLPIGVILDEFGALANGTGSFGTKQEANSIRGGVDNGNFWFWYQPSDGGIAGGIIGMSDDAAIKDCLNTGAVDGDYMAGGFLGKGYRTSMETSYNSASVRSKFCAGGAVGFLRIFSAGSPVTNCATYGAVEGTQICGGFAGVLTCEWSCIAGGSIYSGAEVAIDIPNSYASSMAVAQVASEVQLSDHAAPGFDFEKIWMLDPVTGDIDLQMNPAEQTK